MEDKIETITFADYRLQAINDNMDLAILNLGLIIIIITIWTLTLILFQKAIQAMRSQKVET